MPNSLELAEEIVRKFRGRTGTYAAAVGKAFNPYAGDVRPADLVRAWEKGVSAGFYLLTAYNDCHCSCLDFDDHGKDSEAIAKAAIVARVLQNDAGIKTLLEISQSGQGAHCWIFHPDTPAVQVRQFWKAVLSKADEYAEIYPKQDSLDGLSLGNLIRYPLFGESRFVDTELKPVDSLEALRSTDIVSRDELQKIIDWWSADSIVVPKSDTIVNGLPARVTRLIEADPGSTLTVRWLGDSVGMSDASGSAIVQAIAVELVRGYVPTHEIEQALRWWGKKHEYAKCDREDFVRRTVEKAYDMAIGRKTTTKGKTFIGMSHRFADDLLKGEDKVFRFGIDKLDASMGGGYAPSELTVVCARASNGKTAQALQYLDYAAACGRPGLLCSLEMSDRENARRIISTISDGVAAAKTADGNKKVHNAIDSHYASRAPLFFSDEFFHINDIEREIKSHVERHHIQVVVLDYMGLARSNFQKEYESQTEIVRRLKQLAKDLDIAVIALVQLKREQYGDDALRPAMRHLRSSGEIENTADNIVAGVWPWKVDASKHTNKNEYRIHVLKCRNRGITDPEIPVYFEYEKQRFM